MICHVEASVAAPPAALSRGTQILAHPSRGAARVRGAAMQSPIQSLNRCLVASLHRCHGPKQPLPGGAPPTGSDGAPPSGSELASPSSPAGSPPGSPRAAAVDGVAPRVRPLSSLLRLYDVLLALAVGLVCAHSLWDGSLGSALCVCGLALAAALSTCLLGVREGRGSSGADGSARSRRADRAKAARVARSLSASMLATPPEQVVIDEVMAALRANPEEGLESSGPVLEVQLLRFIREHGSQPAKIERLFRKAVQWKVKHLPHHMMAELKQAAQARLTPLPSSSPRPLRSLPCRARIPRP